MEPFHIGQIARFFDLPASKLRYWEQAGVLAPHKNADNSYREYTVSDLMTLSDLIFYKNLGISLQQIREIEQASLDEHQSLLCGKVAELAREQQQIAQRMRKLHAHLSAIQTVHALRRQPFAPAEIDTDCIVSFDLEEIPKLRQYIENPYLYSRVQHTAQFSAEQRGLTIPRDSCVPPAQVLWRNTGQHRWVTCLMQEQVQDGYDNNLSALLDQVQQQHRTGVIISRFLLRATDQGTLYDFYKTFIEIVD